MSEVSSRKGRRRGPAITGLAVLAAILSAMPANAEQLSYRYDALGRLVQVEQTRAGGWYDARYTYDRAGNRTRQDVTGVGNVAGGGAAVVPHRGKYRIIPVTR